MYRDMQVKKSTNLHNFLYETHPIGAQIIFGAYLLSIFHLKGLWVVVDVWIFLPSLKRVLMQFTIKPFFHHFR